MEQQLRSAVANPGEITTRRFSCEYCRLRKVKCDGQKPICGNCTWRGMRECIYLGLPRRRRKDSATQPLPSPSSSIATNASMPPISIAPIKQVSFSIPQHSYYDPSYCDHPDPANPDKVRVSPPDAELPLLQHLHPDHTYEDVERLLKGLNDNKNLIMLFCYHYNTVFNEFYDFELDLQLSLLAFGAAFSQDPSHTWYYEQARAAMIEQFESPTMACLQSGLILYMCSHLRRDMSAAWVLLSMACRLALLFQLDMDPDELVYQSMYAGLTPYDKEKRRRCWWNCYLLELLIATYICRPRILKKHSVKFPISESKWEKLSPYYSVSTKPGKHFITETIDAGDHPVTHIIKISEIILCNFKLRILRQFGRNPDDPAMATIKMLEQVYPDVGRVTSLEQAHNQFRIVDQAIATFLSELPPHLLLPLPTPTPSARKRNPHEKVADDWDHDDSKHIASLWLDVFLRIDPNQPPWTLLCLNYLYYGAIIGLHSEWIYFILQTTPDEDDEEEEDDRRWYLQQLKKSLGMLQHASTALASLSARLYKCTKNSKAWGGMPTAGKSSSGGSPKKTKKIPTPYPINMGAICGVFGAGLCYAESEGKWLSARLEQTVCQTNQLAMGVSSDVPRSDSGVINDTNTPKLHVEELFASMIKWQECIQCQFDLFGIVDERIISVLQPVLDMCTVPNAIGAASPKPAHFQLSASTIVTADISDPATDSQGNARKPQGIWGDGIQNESDRQELPTVQAIISSYRLEVGMVLAACDKLTKIVR